MMAQFVRSWRHSFSPARATHTLAVWGVAGFLSVLTAGTVTQAHAATFYVSPTGSDTASGSQSAPWLTLQKAADSVHAGDTVQVSAGTYKGFVLWQGPSGSANAPITFHAAPGTIINQPNYRTNDGINLEAASYIVIEGFTVRGVPRAGIRSVTNTNVTIRNNSLENNGYWGVITGFSDYLLIENNVAFGTVNQHGIYVGNSCTHPTVRKNVLYSNSGCGLHMNGDASLGSYGLILNALVEQNIIYDNGRSGGSGINGDGVQNSVIRNNLLYNNHASGISLYQIDGADSSKNNVVENNTVLQASDGRWALNIADGSTGNTVLNNILLSNHSFRGALSIDPASLTGLTSDYNIMIDRVTLNGGDTVISLASWKTTYGKDSHSFVSSAAQLFVDPATNDYRLSATSTALDRGTSQSAPAVDLEGTARPQGAGFDVGAYERASGGGGGDTISPSVTLNAPPPGATVSGTVNVTGSASDNVGVTSVELYVDNVIAGSSTNPSFSISWNSATVANGSHTLTAKAYDAAGNVGSASITVTVSNSTADTTPPNVTISNPANGAVLSGSSTTIITSAADNIAVKKLVISVDGKVKKTCSPTTPGVQLSCQYKWSSIRRGTHTVRATATDTSSNSSTATSSVRR